MGSSDGHPRDLPKGKQARLTSEEQCRVLYLQKIKTLIVLNRKKHCRTLIYFLQLIFFLKL